MKKIIYFLLLVVAIIISGVSAEAKTTKKKSRTTATQRSINFGPSSIIKKCNEGYYDINDDLKNTLIQEGFSFIETKNENREIADSEGVEVVEVQVSYFENNKEGIKIEIVRFLWDNSIDSIEIKFTNAGSEKEFTNELIKMGYKMQPARMASIDFKPPYDKGNLIWVSKNKNIYSVYYGG